MKSKKRQRGRPKGAVTYHDGRYLDEVADEMIRNPKLRKTPPFAMVAARHFPDFQETRVTKRFERAWKKTGEERLAEARERRDAARRARHSSGGGTISFANMLSQRYFDELTITQQVVHDMERIANPLASAMKLVEESGVHKAMVEIASSPTMRLFADMQKQQSGITAQLGKLF